MPSGSVAPPTEAIGVVFSFQISDFRIVVQFHRIFGLLVGSMRSWTLGDQVAGAT